MDYKLKLVLIRKLLRKEGSEGFSLIELVVVVAVLAVLSAIAIPSFTEMSERAEASVAQYQLAVAAKECAALLASGEPAPSYTVPSNTSRFQYPDSGPDGKCLINSTTGNILTAARTAYGQTVSTYNLNVNLLTGEKTTERNVPSYITWK